MEQITAMIEAAIKGALSAEKTKPEIHSLDERHFRRIEKFNGEMGKWREWSFQPKTAMGAVNRDVREVLDRIQNYAKDPNWEDVFMETTEASRQRYGAELYNLIVTLVSGEALTVVRGVAGDGWEAWHRLQARFDPKTPARALRLMMQVMQPKKVKDIREVQGAVTEWEVKVAQLNTEHGIELDDKILVALLTTMIPNEFQDHVFQMSDEKTSFKGIKDKILTMALNRASLSRPMPMEVDQVRKDWYDGGGETDEWQEEGQAIQEDYELEVDYVGEKCLRCGGLGHYARECPTPKGKGKGQGWKGGGKGQMKGQKGEPKGKGKGKGKGGKGFGGVCWNCGMTGHRASECRQPQPYQHQQDTNDMQIGAVHQDHDTAVGGVWAIAQVEAEEWVEVPIKKRGPMEVQMSDLIERAVQKKSQTETWETSWIRRTRRA